MTISANADQIRYWNEVSGGTWVELNEQLDAELEPFGRIAMDAADLAQGARVIDVGCGCGATVLALAARVGPSGFVHGLDVSAPMLGHARARIEQARVDNVRLDLADAQVAALDAASYDVVFSRFGVMFFDDPVGAFANLKSALKSRGRLAFVCWRAVEQNEWALRTLQVVKSSIELPSPPPPRSPGPFAFAEESYVEQILGEAGYSDVKVRAIDAPIRIAGGGSLDRATTFLLRSGPAARAFRAAGITDLGNIPARLREALAPFEGPDGVVMGSSIWCVTARQP